MTNEKSALVPYVKGRLLPLSMLPRILERLVEVLPRKVVSVSLIPKYEITVLDQAKGEYKASGDAPEFEIVVTPELRSGGWFYLEAALVRHNGDRKARIHGIAPSSSKTDFDILIPSNLRGSIREVFWLPKNVSILYWSPTGHKGFFYQSELLIHKISALESALRRIYRVAYELWRLRYQKAGCRGGLTWGGLLFNLQNAYTQTANLQLRRYNPDYLSFIQQNDTLKPADVSAMRSALTTLQHFPVITLVIILRNPRADWLSTTIDAVAQQIYRVWNLVIAGDIAADPECAAVIEAKRKGDERIKVIFYPSDTGKAGIFNQVLSLVHGDFIAELGQHDVLPVHSLACLIRELDQYPDTDLIYTDHDELDESGVRMNHCFKPDWNPDLLTSYYYFGDLCLYRTSLVSRLGGYRAGLEGAEAYDLALRVIKDTATLKIRHITKVLYHKRSAGGYVKKGSVAEDQAHQAGKRALKDYFTSSGVCVEDGPGSCLYRIHRPLPKEPPLVSMIIPTRDKLDILKACVESIIQKTNYPNWEMLIVDNDTTDPAAIAYLRDLQSHKSIRVLEYRKPFNYSAINNFAVGEARGEILALLNNDVEVISPDWLGEMVGHAIRPEVGAVGAKLLYSSGLVQHAGVVLGIGGVAGHAHKYLDDEEPGYCHRAEVIQNFSAVTGACLVVRKRLYQEVGGLNETDLKIALNDVEFCLKLKKAGYNNVFTPYAKLYHHESISRGHDDTPEKHWIFIQERNYLKEMWGEMLLHDDLYNPNLTLESEDFSLRRYL